MQDPKTEFGDKAEKKPKPARRMGGKFYNPKMLPRVSKTMNRPKFGFQRPHGQEA